MTKDPMREPKMLCRTPRMKGAFIGCSDLLEQVSEMEFTFERYCIPCKVPSEDSNSQSEARIRGTLGDCCIRGSG